MIMRIYGMFRLIVLSRHLTVALSKLMIFTRKKGRDNSVSIQLITKLRSAVVFLSRYS